MPRKDKDIAIALRKGGKSYNEIRSILNIPKSTLSDWFRESDWSKEIKDKLHKKSEETGRINLKKLDHIRGIALEQIYAEARLEAIHEFEILKFHPTFIAGLALYWGEGNKAGRGKVRLANIDPTMIKVFIAFLHEICGVPKEQIAISILVYPDLDQTACLRFWSENIGLPMQNFRKCVTIQGRHKTKRLPYGVCNIGINSTYLKTKLLVWIEMLPHELLQHSYYPAGIV